MEELSVSQLVEVINHVLTSLTDVRVIGEVSEFKIIHNKWVTFQIKDESSSIGCFMPVWQYRTAVEDGMLVRVQGQPRLRNKGFFSFVLTRIEPAGEGALRRAFELLRQKLTAEGLFAPERKRALPRFPEHVVLITSRDAAAYSDFLKVLRARQGGLTVSFLHTQVQGDIAPQQIVHALQFANTGLKNVDAIVLVRGGGSLEDLQAFNDETVVQAVAASRAPTIVGVGHERDVTLAELAADIRASTPSNAAELLVRSREELVSDLEQISARLRYAVRSTYESRQQVIAHQMSILRSRIIASQRSVSDRIHRLRIHSQNLRHLVALRRERLIRCRQLLSASSNKTVSAYTERLDHYQRTLRTLSPNETLKRGYSITKNSDGSLVKDTSLLQVGEIVRTSVAKGSFSSKVLAE